MNIERSFGYVYPDLCLLWNTKRNKITPFEISYGSNQDVWWECKEGHEWIESPKSISKLESPCPYCSGRKILKGYNDIFSTHKFLVDEWDFEKNSNNNPDNISFKSKKPVFWKCSCGHSFKSSPYDRYRTSYVCQTCNKESKTSFSEQAIFYYMKKLFKNCTNTALINSFEADIYVKDKKLIVEYDGYFYHKKRMKFDISKNKSFCNYHFYRLRESGLEEVSDFNCVNIFLEGTGTKSLEAGIINLLQAISRDLSMGEINKFIKCEGVNLERDSIEIYNQYVAKVKKNSLAEDNPSLAREWHTTLNGSITPYQVAKNSNKKFWWKCDKGHEWISSVNNRNGSSNRCGCPYCSNQKLLKGFNDLETVYPEISKEWNYYKNPLPPSEYRYGSSKRVWWINSEGKEWQTTIDNRTRRYKKQHSKIEISDFELQTFGNAGGN